MYSMLTPLDSSALQHVGQAAGRSGTSIATTSVTLTT